MNNCSRCNSDRIASVSAKCSDMCNVRYQGTEKDYYVPKGLGIGGGDYVEFDYCLNCGQIQGAFPIADNKIKEAGFGPKNYTVYHWDTFDEPGEDTSKLESFDTQEDAEEWVEREYRGRIRNDGADQVHIVLNATGEVVKRYKVG